MVPRARFLVVVVLVATALGGAVEAAAEDGEVDHVSLRFAERRGQLVVQNLGLSSLLFDKDAYRKLKYKALGTTVVLRLYVYRKGRAQPVSYRFMTMRIVYDLWLEKYQVRIDGPAGRDNGRFRRLDQAFKKITELANIPIADLGDIPIGPHHYLGIFAELNPVSEETQAEVRRWLSRPAGSTSLARGQSFFGSFVSIFVNAPPPQADRVIRVRSQPFYRVPR